MPFRVHPYPPLSSLLLCAHPSIYSLPKWHPKIARKMRTRMSHIAAHTHTNGLKPPPHVLPPPPLELPPRGEPKQPGEPLPEARAARSPVSFHVREAGRADGEAGEILGGWVSMMKEGGRGGGRKGGQERRGKAAGRSKRESDEASSDNVRRSRCSHRRPARTHESTFLKPT
jgi:hypothetical protein